ncbi:MAG TPA: DUF2062 domain-containing protein [Labilithrix sp.]|nr:DUF2062 domain-containing protein [Labilithrix sp.]
MFGRLWAKLKALWKIAKSERASPREIGWAVGIGAFAGCTPALGVHGALAVALATLFKKNRLFAWLGSRTANVLLLPFIVIAEVQVSHRLRTGTWVHLDRESVLDQAGMFLLDWCLGTIPVGLGIAVILGGASWALARHRQLRSLANSSIAIDEPSAAGTKLPPNDAVVSALQGEGLAPSSVRRRRPGAPKQSWESASSGSPDRHQ